MGFKFFLMVIMAVAAMHASAQWGKVNNFPANNAQSYAYLGTTIWIGTYNNGVYRSDDGMQTWVQLSTGLANSQARHVNQIVEHNGFVFIATDDGIYRFDSTNNSWVKKSNGLIVGGGATYIFAESIYHVGDRLITGVYNGIYTSTDNGENWVITNTSGMHVWAKNFTMHHGKLFAARETNNTPNGFISLDSGKTFSPFNTFSLPMITFYSEGDTLWAGTIHGTHFSLNDGQTWSVRNNGYSLDPYTSSFLRWNGILFTTLKFGTSGVYASVNNGLQWWNIGSRDGIPFLIEISDIFIFSNNLYLVTTGGLYKRSLDDFKRIFALTEGWNIVSLPLITTSSSKNTLFPNANSGVYSYQNGYVSVDSLARGKGYWMKNSAAENIAVYGIPDSVKDISLTSGWNLIGPKDRVQHVNTVTTIPAGLIISPFFLFQDGYQNAEQISPARGYWVKSNGNGKLLLQ